MNKKLTKKFIWWYIRYLTISLIMLIPAFIVNYVIVYFGILELKGLWLFGPVILGDIVAFALNFHISVAIMLKVPRIRDLYTKMQLEAKEMSNN